jgi:hypothetical protein
MVLRERRSGDENHAACACSGPRTTATKCALWTCIARRVALQGGADVPGWRSTAPPRRVAERGAPGSIAILWHSRDKCRTSRTTVSPRGPSRGPAVPHALTQPSDNSDLTSTSATISRPPANPGERAKARVLAAEVPARRLLNRYERSWRLAGGESGERVADLISVTRRDPELSALAPSAVALRETFASVIAPVLVAFVEHVLADCVTHGIAQVAFLARDGQLPYLIAKRIVAARGLPVHALYVYGSRHALHIAGYTDIDTAASWLLEDTHELSLVDVAQRGELPLELLEQVAHGHGYLRPNENISRSRRAGLHAVIRDPRIQAALAAASERAWPPAHAYYRAAGFAPDTHVALVDVGWSGRMQCSLGGILERGALGPTHIRGHYLCLATRANLSPHDTLCGFLHDPARDAGACPFDPYRPVVESALAADHGTTLGFELVAGVATPLLGAPLDEAAHSIVGHQHATVLSFVAHMLDDEGARGTPIRWSAATVREHLRLFLVAPSTTDARAFERRTHHDGQADTLRSSLARRLPRGKLLQRRSLGLWPEATYRLSGAGTLLALLRVIRVLNTAVLPWLCRIRSRLLRGLHTH